MDLMNLLQGHMSDNILDFLGNQIGAQDKDQTETATAGIVSTLIGALAKNASTPEGAESLNNALERDHDGSILDNITGFLSGNNQPQNEKALDGSGILWHLLGDKQNTAAEMISKNSGLDSGKVMSLMSMLAPIVMGVLGKTKQQSGLDIGGLMGLLSNTRQNQESQNPMMSLVARFLDSDGDGSMMDDVANMGMNMLSGFFRKG